MWKSFVLGALALGCSACSGPTCVRNSQCTTGLECRDTICQAPLPPPQPDEDAGPYECNRGIYCGGRSGALGGNHGGGHEAINTSTRYQGGFGGDAAGASGGGGMGGNIGRDGGMSSGNAGGTSGTTAGSAGM